MIVVITGEAEADLENIGDVIAADNPRRAMTFVDELVEACERLADFPRRYPLLPRYAASGIGRRVFGEYLIFYRVVDAQIDVLHVLGGARDYEAILFPSD